MLLSSYFENAIKKLNDFLNRERDDPLYLTRCFTTGLAKFKMVNWVLFISLTINVSLLLIEIIYFSMDFDLKQFIQFFSLSVGFLQSYSIMWITIAYENEAVKTVSYQDDHFIKLGTVKESTYGRIIECVTLRRYLFLLNGYAANQLYIFLWPLFGYEDEYYFTVFFFNEYIGPIFGQTVVNVLRVCFYISFYPAVVSSLIPVQLILYLLSHMEFQLIVIEDNIRDIDNTPANESLVSEELKYCIKQYLHVKTNMDMLKEWIFWPMMLTVIGCFILLLSYSYFVIAQASLAAFPRVFSLGLISACSAAIYAICGQGLVDQCENVNRSLYFMRWYEYSKKNCGLLRMFMVTTYKSLYLNVIGYDLAIDATLIMKVYKFLFSSLATIQQIVALRRKDE